MFRETKDYKIEVIEPLLQHERSHYGIVNKHTGVVEYKSELLPQVIKVLPEVQKALDEVTLG